MATYKEIRGTNIEVVSSDPSNPVVGQVWYNSTDNVVKGFYVNPGSWSTGGTLNTPRGTMGAAGIQTAGLVFGGQPPLPVTAVVESYNGTNWTEVNDLNLARMTLAGAGTQTAAVAFGGLSPPAVGGPPNSNANQTETWNGTNWTEVNDLNTGRRNIAGDGIQTSALGFGGYQDSGGPPTSEFFALTESWNGTNWTEVNDLNYGRNNLGAAADSNTAALAFGGNHTPSPAGLALTELWNGSNWTEVNDLNQSRRGLAGAGISTAALAFAGSADGVPTAPSLTEIWNGTNWTETGDLSSGKSGMGGLGTNTLALAAGGDPAQANSEEFNLIGGVSTIDAS
jgi:hypothetical protein